MVAGQSWRSRRPLHKRKYPAKPPDHGDVVVRAAIIGCNLHCSQPETAVLGVALVLLGNENLSWWRLGHDSISPGDLHNGRK